MTKQITNYQLEGYLWGSAEFLRNKIDAGDYKAYIFPLLFYKRISDVYDEEYQQAIEESDGDLDYANSSVNHRFQIPDGCHWNDLRKTSKNVGQKILKSIRQMEKANPDTLYSIFGDANWGNKERLSDETLINLIEHFSSLKLSIETVSDDVMGTAYEYLIKQFADDSGHTAAEFYTNRTVITLMTELLDPKPNESIYDPTCGTGGMLIECVNHLKKQNKDFRTLKLFGQEKNIITSGIARMNMFLHGFEDSKIKRGDTLRDPLFLKNDKLQKFDIILANPPYSVNSWDRKGWNRDPYGRNIYGTPPQSKADYAFIQHIICSLTSRGRSAILLPHGVLFRDGEENIRRKLIDDDKLDTIIGLPKDMFYNSIMSSCILIFSSTKEKKRRNNILFINAEKDFERIDKKNFLNETHIQKIVDVYEKFKNIPNYAYVVSHNEIKLNKNNLNIAKYIKNKITDNIPEPKTALRDLYSDYENVSKSLKIFQGKLKVEK